MKRPGTRRDLLKAASLGTAAGPLLNTLATRQDAIAAVESSQPSDPVKVVVWDEQQPAQKQAYPNFLARRSPAIFDLNPA